MRLSKLLRVAVALACLGIASGAKAQGWTFPTLHPFKSEERETPSHTPPPAGWPAAVDDEPPTSGFKLPKLRFPQLPKLGAGPKPRQPSLMQKFGQGTKNFFSKTADLLTPWDSDEKPQRRSRAATGVRRSYSGSPGARKTEDRSWLPSWLSGGEEPEPPRTVNGFIAQPRPKY